MEQATEFSYYYGGESEQFSFYRIPRQLVTGSYFKNLSTDAKLLYGLLLDRMSLSAKNGWYDELGRVYIYYPMDEIQEALGCGHDKAIKLLAELDAGKGVGLIERVKQGQGRPAKIYVKQFTSPMPPTLPRLPNNGSSDFGKAEVKSSESQKSRLPKSGSADFRKSDGSYIDINNTYRSYLDLSIHPSAPEPIDRRSCKEQICENIDYDWLRRQRKDHEMEEIDELIAIMVDTVCSTKPTVKIGGEEIPAADVRERLLSLDSSHIEYVLDRLRETTTKIHNIHAYLLSALYRAPTTVNHFYRAEVQHDEYGTP